MEHGETSVQRSPLSPQDTRLRLIDIDPTAKQMTAPVVLLNDQDIAKAAPYEEIKVIVLKRGCDAMRGGGSAPNRVSSIMKVDFKRVASDRNARNPPPL
jgi:hypothetical protein